MRYEHGAMKDPYDFLPWNPDKSRLHIVRMPEVHTTHKLVDTEKHEERQPARKSFSADHFIVLFWLVLMLLMLMQCRLSF